MGVFRVFKLNLWPRKRTVFQLNRVKTRDFLLYIFLLLLLISLPNGLQLIGNSIQSGEFGNEFPLILFFYSFLIILFGLFGISFLAVIGLLITTVTKRKLVYHLLWKMSVYALTYPVILYTFFDLLGITDGRINVLLIVIFLVVYCQMILAYPKAKKRPLTSD